MVNYALTDLIDLEILCQLQDGFEKYTGLDAVVTDAFVNPVTPGRIFDDFVNDILESTDDGKNPFKIKDEYLKILKQGETVNYKNDENIFQEASPIMVEGEFLGLFICGSIQKKSKSNFGQIKKGAKFLSNIASVLSRIAYGNYLLLNNSNVMQQAAKNQTVAITETALKLKKSMQEWATIINEALSMNDVSIIKKNLQQVLIKGNDLYNVVDYSVKAIQDKTETISLLETEYNLRHLVSAEIARIRKVMLEKQIAFSYKIDGSVPHFLFGDNDRIGHIIYKLFLGSAGRIDSGRVHMEFLCKEMSYSKTLVIKYTDLNQGFSEVDLEALKMFIATSDETYLKTGSPFVYDYYSLNHSVQQLYGQIDFNVISETHSEFLITIPQLEIEVEEIGI